MKTSLMSKRIIMTVVFKAHISLDFIAMKGIKSNDIYSCLI